MRKIVVCGKGGVGKSLIAYYLSKALEDMGKKVILLDADESNTGLKRIFGSTQISLLDYLGGRKKFKSLPKGSSLINTDTLLFSDLPEEVVSVSGRIHFINVGKITEPMEGCACAMGKVAREFIDKLKLEEDEYLLVDTEAGIEHFGRGVEEGIDTIIIVAEPSFEALEVGAKIKELSQKLDKKVVFVINKTPSDLQDTLQDMLGKKGISPDLILPYEKEVFLSLLKGETPPFKECYKLIKEFLKRPVQ